MLIFSEKKPIWNWLSIYSIIAFSKYAYDADLFMFHFDSFHKICIIESFIHDNLLNWF